jgi:hypothetical protein
LLGLRVEALVVLHRLHALHNNRSLVTGVGRNPAHRLTDGKLRRRDDLHAVSEELEKRQKTAQEGLMSGVCAVTIPYVRA